MVIETLTEEAMLTLLVELACGNPKRSKEHQAALLQACGRLDDIMVNWTGWAEESWDLEWCNDCDRTLPRGDRCVCGDPMQFFSVAEA